MNIPFLHTMKKEKQKKKVLIVAGILAVMAVAALATQYSGTLFRGALTGQCTPGPISATPQGLAFDTQNPTGQSTINMTDPCPIMTFDNQHYELTKLDGSYSKFWNSMEAMNQEGIVTGESYTWGSTNHVGTFTFDSSHLTVGEYRFKVLSGTDFQITVLTLDVREPTCEEVILEATPDTLVFNRQNPIVRTEFQYRLPPDNKGICPGGTVQEHSELQLRLLDTNGNQIYTFPNIQALLQTGIVTQTPKSFTNIQYDVDLRTGRTGHGFVEIVNPQTNTVLEELEIQVKEDICHDTRIIPEQSRLTFYPGRWTQTTELRYEAPPEGLVPCAGATVTDHGTHRFRLINEETGEEKVWRGFDRLQKSGFVKSQTTSYTSLNYTFNTEGMATGNYIFRIENRFGGHIMAEIKLNISDRERRVRIR